MITVYLYCEVCGRFFTCSVGRRDLQSSGGITFANCVGDRMLNTTHERAVLKVVKVDTP